MEKDKLIRDKYIDLFPEEEKDKLYYCEDKEQQFNFLKEKLTEEVEELRDSNFEDISEFADVFEVLEALLKFKGISYPDLADTMHKKAINKGKFNDFLILKETKE